MLLFSLLTSYVNDSMYCFYLVYVIQVRCCYINDMFICLDRFHFFMIYCRLSTMKHILADQRWNQQLLLAARKSYCLFSFIAVKPCFYLFYIIYIDLIPSFNLQLRINSTIQIVEHKEALRATNALEIMSKYP